MLRRTNQISVATTQSILPLATNIVRDVLDDPIDPNLQKEMDLVQHLLIQGASADAHIQSLFMKEPEKENYKGSLSNLLSGSPSYTSQMTIIFWNIRGIGNF
jgi:hypothetical protein